MGCALGQHNSVAKLPTASETVLDEAAEEVYDLVPPLPRYSKINKADNPFVSGRYAAPVMTAEEVKRISVPFSNVREALPGVMDEYGLAVVTGVVSQGELPTFEEKFKADLENLVDVEAVETASESVKDAFRRFQDRGPGAFPAATAAKITEAAGFAIMGCLPHGSFAWAVRQHPNVHEVYRSLFPDASDLVTSLDVPFFSPAGQGASEQNTFSAHCDQNESDVRPGLADMASYQGVLYIWPAESEASSTTIAWPGSHKTAYHDVVKDCAFVRSGRCGMHYCQISEMRDTVRGMVLAAGWQEHARRVPVPAGAMILWNSRTLHTGWRGGPRLAQTVCLEPAGRRSANERLAKLRLVALGLPACHWASVGMQHDMSLGAPGYFGKTRLEMKDAEEHDKIVLPLRPAIRPVPLSDGADLQKLQSLVQVSYKLLGMWVVPDVYRGTLEQAVIDEFKQLL